MEHDDRRKHRRYEALFPMCLETRSGWKFVAMSDNASQSGMLAVTAAELDPDAEITLFFKLSDNDDEHFTVQGRIVRVEENDSEESGLWPTRVAVEFTSPLPEVEQFLAGVDSVRLRKDSERT